MARPLKVLLLYQFDHSIEDSPASRFVSDTQNDLNGMHFEGFEVHVVRLSSHANPDAGNTILMNLATAVGDCDYAIALLTFDSRPASVAGNLWYEVGYWLARREGQLLMIKHNSDDSSINSSVEIPTNLSGLVYKDAKTSLEAKAHFTDFLGHAARYPSHRRIVERFRETLATGEWIISEKEHARLSPLMADSPVRRALPRIEAYSCHVHLNRIVKQRPGRLHFRLGVEPFQRSEETPTYRWTFGSGLLTDEEQATLTQLVGETRGGEKGIPEFFSLRKGPSVKSGQRSVNVRFAEAIYSNLSHDIYFDCDWADECSDPFEINVEFDVLLLDKQGWLMYRAPFCTFDHLFVSLEAPFEILGFPSIWPRDSRPQMTERWIGKQVYRSELQVSTTVFAGSTHLWLFDPERHRKRRVWSLSRLLNHLRK
jgi:hypothetical protein